MQILELIDQLDNLVFEAKPLPFSNSVRVDREHVFDLLDQMRAVLPEGGRAAKPEVDETGEDDSEAAGLRRVATTLEALRDEHRPAPRPLTAAASDQVRTIVQTAEREAGQLCDEAKAKVEADLAGAEQTVARARGEAERLREDSERIRAEADAHAATVREEAERHAERIIKQAERIRSEATRSAAELSRDQVERMAEAAGAMSEGAAKADAEFNALLERIQAPAIALSELLGPEVGALKKEVEDLRARIAAVDAPTRALGAAPDAPQPIERATPPTELDLGELPGDADPVEAARIDAEDASEPAEPDLDAFDDADADEAEEENLLEPEFTTVADPTDTGDLGADELWAG
jgi:hypothetical protein